MPFAILTLALSDWRKEGGPSPLLPPFADVLDWRKEGGRIIFRGGRMHVYLCPPLARLLPPSFRRSPMSLNGGRRGPGPPPSAGLAALFFRNENFNLDFMVKR